MSAETVVGFTKTETHSFAFKKKSWKFCHYLGFSLLCFPNNFLSFVERDKSQMARLQKTHLICRIVLVFIWAIACNLLIYSYFITDCLLVFNYVWTY